MNKLHAHSLLLDPRTCGEDLPAMVSRMSELAPRLCRDCADYHLRFAITRCVSPFDKGIAVDRALLIEKIRCILSTQQRTGSWTSSLPEQPIPAFWRPVLTRSPLWRARSGKFRFTVLTGAGRPWCSAPNLQKGTGCTCAPSRPISPPVDEAFAADLIISHSFLRFLDRPGQIDLLKKFDDWLRPEGSIVVSQSIRPKDKSHLGKEVRRLGSNLALARAAVADGRIVLAPQAMPVFERLFASDHDHLTRSGDVASTGDLRDLLLEAGLRERSIDVVERDFPPVDQQKLTRVRAVAVCGSSRNV